MVWHRTRQWCYLWRHRHKIVKDNAKVPNSFSGCDNFTSNLQLNTGHVKRLKWGEVATKNSVLLLFSFKLFSVIQDFNSTMHIVSACKADWIDWIDWIDPFSNKYIQFNSTFISTFSFCTCRHYHKKPGAILWWMCPLCCIQQYKTEQYAHR